MENGALSLSYFVDGDIAGILLPAPRTSAAADGLWQHTCCEAFIAAVDQPGYRELNFSPSGQWAIYAFSDYRQRDNNYLPESVPVLTFSECAQGFRLDALLAPSLLPAGQQFDMALTLVLEAKDGSKTYWALQHVAEQPDFHHRESFSLNLKVNKP